MKKVLIVLAVLICGNLFAQKSQQELNQLMQERNEYYFTFNLNDNDDLNVIAHTISVDRVDGNVVTAYANNKEFAKFQKFGYEVTLQTPPAEQVHLPSPPQPSGPLRSSGSRVCLYLQGLRSSVSQSFAA